MAVEAAIAPHRKAELHARLLAALEERGDADPALLAHHAEGAGDAEAVLRHAPEAARRSSALGAHREAAAQFERALRFAGERDRPTLAALHEGLAGEYSLLDRWEEAERALRDRARAAARAGRRPERRGGPAHAVHDAVAAVPRARSPAEAAEEAVRVLEALPPGRELAWAYASLGAVPAWWRAERRALSSIGEKARALGERLREPDVVSYALNAIGLALV